MFRWSELGLEKKKIWELWFSLKIVFQTIQNGKRLNGQQTYMKIGSTVKEKNV